MVCMTDTKTVERFMVDLEEEGCECVLDLEAGTCEAKDDGQTVYKGVRKGAAGQPWIVRCSNSDRIKFN